MRKLNKKTLIIISAFLSLMIIGGCTEDSSNSDTQKSEISYTSSQNVSGVYENTDIQDDVTSVSYEDSASEVSENSKNEESKDVSKNGQESSMPLDSEGEGSEGKQNETSTHESSHENSQSVSEDNSSELSEIPTVDQSVSIEELKPTKIEVSEIYFNTDSVSLKVGNSIKGYVTILPENASDKSLEYYTDNKNVAYVDNYGNITAVSPGTTTITVRTSNGKSASCKVTVYNVPSRIMLNKTYLELVEGHSYTLSAETDIGTSNILFDWNSSNSSVISVENTKDSKAKITAKSAGTATVTVTTNNGISASCSITVKTKKPETDTDTSSYIDEVIRLVNSERAKNGLLPLAKRNDLCPLADIRAKEIVQNFSHTRPDGSECFSIVQDKNIPYTALGENIAYGYMSPEDVMSGWMKSQGHRANILSEDFNGIGVGLYKSGGIYYWVQIFIHD